MRTVLLLLASNVFMTIAWYGHLKYKHHAIWKVILASWGIAFFEYCLQVPANRWGHGQFSAFELKLLQEIITLTVFVGFSIWYLGEHPRWNHAVAALFVVGAVVFAFLPDKPPLTPP
ncbi:MAG: DMT family protein [Deltaproteobacteria bacterium]|nr:DMT family protein [Deltaproteobacteria bacterium]